MEEKTQLKQFQGDHHHRFQMLQRSELECG